MSKASAAVVDGRSQMERLGSELATLSAERGALDRRMRSVRNDFDAAVADVVAADGDLRLAVDHAYDNERVHEWLQATVASVSGLTEIGLTYDESDESSPMVLTSGFSVKRAADTAPLASCVHKFLDEFAEVCVDDGRARFDFMDQSLSQYASFSLEVVMPKRTAVLVRMRYYSRGEMQFPNVTQALEFIGRHLWYDGSTSDDNDAERLAYGAGFAEVDQ